VAYSLNVTVTDNFVPPSPFAAGSDSAMFSMSVIMAESLVPMAPTTGATWFFNDAMTEQGVFRAVVPLPDPATGMTEVHGEWDFGTVPLKRGVSSDTSLFAWHEQVQSHSTGSLVETVSPALTSPLIASFWQQDRVMATLTPIPPPATPPGP